MHLCFKIVKFFYYNLCRSTCFAHYCVHHQEPSTTAYAASGYLHVQWWKAPDDGHNSVRNTYSDIDCNKKILRF
jgi:hypothetical protein